MTSAVPARRRRAAKLSAVPAKISGAAFAAACTGTNGAIAFDALATRLGMSKAQVAETMGVRPTSLQRSARASARKTQARAMEMLEILGRVADWAGGEKQAMAWYRAEPLPEFGGRTAEFLVRDGRAGAVRAYLDHVALGGFA